MTKEQYTMWKTYEPLNIVYHHYTTHEKLNHKPLSPNELFIFLQTKGCNLNVLLADLVQEYDIKFELIALLDSKGSLIKYL